MYCTVRSWLLNKQYLSVKVINLSKHIKHSAAPLRLQEMKSASKTQKSLCSTVYLEIVLKVNTPAFIIQYENKTPAAASDYTHFHWLHSSRSLFSQLQVRGSNEHIIKSILFSSLSILIHTSSLPLPVTLAKLIIFMEMQLCKQGFTILTHPGIPLMISVVWRHLINWWSERERTVEKD